jgi:hypothetical protein
VFALVIFSVDMGWQACVPLAGSQNRVGCSSLIRHNGPRGEGKLMLGGCV